MALRIGLAGHGRRDRACPAAVAVGDRHRAALALRADLPMRLIRTVAAVIRDASGRVLLVRKRGSTIFIQPGGKPEPGEAPLSTLARELEEELGVLPLDGSVRPLGEFEDDAVHEPGLRVRATVFVCAIDRAPGPRAEIEELAWVDPRAPSGLAIAPLSARRILPAVAALDGG